MRLIRIFKLNLVAAVSIIAIFNFIPCIADEENSLDMNVFRAYEIIMGKAVDIKKDINGDIYTLKAEKILKRGRLPWQKIWAHCHALDVSPEHQCPSKDQSSVIFIIESGQDNYYVTQVQPAEKEAEITSLLKEQDRIMREGSNEEVDFQKFINTFCIILEKNDFESFKNIAPDLKIDGEITDETITAKAFKDIRGIHRKYNYHNIFLKDLRQERYPIYKGVYVLGGHEYGYTYIHLHRHNNTWKIKEITHCD